MQSCSWTLTAITTDQFTGLGRAVGPMCVFLCVPETADDNFDLEIFGMLVNLDIV